MSVEQAIENAAAKVRQLKDGVETEEATKTAFIMPFIGQVLGYDIFDPTEVVPEFTADVGLKKGEKVDYALVLDGEVQILIECKKINEELSLENASQLYRYFATTKARIGVLTNGQVWQFYMDIEKPNIMDSKPFMTLDLLNIDEAIYPQLKKMTKPAFDVDSVANSAEQLKYMNALRHEIAAEFKDPSEEMVRLLGGRVFDGRFTRQNLDKFKMLVDRAMKKYLNDQVNERLKSALDSHVDEHSEVTNEESDLEDSEQAEDNGIITTEEELEGFAIIRAIGCAVTPVSRITMRDAKSYCAILFDDNNRRPICRLLFNNLNSLKIVLFTPEGETDTRKIGEVSEIYNFADEIRARIEALSE